MNASYKARITKHNWEDSVIYILSEVETDNIIQSSPTYNDMKSFANEHFYVVVDYVELDHFASAH